MNKKGDTRELLLQCAKKEFLEKGYMKASIREICKQAGVTTGALYFFFQNKEDLFAELVEQPFQMILELVGNHFKHENEIMKDLCDRYDMYTDCIDMDMTKELVELLYRYEEEFYLIVAKSHGSRFEFCVQQLIEKAEQHYKKLIDYLQYRQQKKKVEPYVVHWIAHSQTEFFVNMIADKIPKEEALKSLDGMVRFSACGWAWLFEGL